MDITTACSNILTLENFVELQKRFVPNRSVEGTGDRGVPVAQMVPGDTGQEAALPGRFVAGHGSSVRNEPPLSLLVTFSFSL